MVDEMKCQIIVDEILRRFEESHDYYLHNHDNPVADYVGTIGYGGEALHQIEDAINYTTELDDDQIGYIKSIIKNHDKKTAVDLIQQFSVLDIRHCIKSFSNEILSMTIGEMEQEIDDISGIDQLNDDERKFIIDACRNYCWLSDDLTLMSIDYGYNRWILYIDIDLLEDAMASKAKLKAQAVRNSIINNEKPKLTLIHGGLL